MDNAEAVILLADHKSENPQDDDDSNIIRVAAVKRHNRNIRVILQLHDSRHKVISSLIFLPTIPCDLHQKDSGEILQNRMQSDEILFNQMELQGIVSNTRYMNCQILHNEL